jgi:hypothetical protein
MREIAERGQDAARVRAHRRPDATAGAVSAPLASDRGAFLEQHRLESFGCQITRDGQSGRAGADDPDLSHWLTSISPALPRELQYAVGERSRIASKV